MISRRTFILCGISGSLLAAVAFTGGARAWIRAQLTENFGRDIAEQAISEGFDSDYLEFLEKAAPSGYARLDSPFRLSRLPFLPSNEIDDGIRDHMIDLFLKSSNFIKFSEQGEAFEYTGLFLPDEYPCSNQLSSFPGSSS